MRTLAQQCPVTADTATPVLGGAANAKTLAVFRYLRSLKGRPEVIWGVADRHDVPSAGSYSGAYDAFRTQTGRVPAAYTLEYHDPAWTTGFTGANGWQANLTTEVQRAFGLGTRIFIVNAHMGNPVTGALSRNGQTGAVSSATGYSQDCNSAPLAAIKTGGAQEAQFLAWMDSFYTFCNGPTFSYGGYQWPVIVRLFHENSGVSFWWGVGDNTGDHTFTNYVDVWQKMVNYFKTTKSAANMLFMWHADTYSLPLTSNWGSIYPGDSYVDIVSYSRYDDGGTANIDDSEGLMDIGYASLRAVAPSKIYAIGECGFVGDNTGSLWDQRVCQPMVQQYQDVSFFTTWRNEPGVFKWGPGGDDSAARKASAAAAVLNPNVITAERCPL